MGPGHVVHVLGAARGLIYRRGLWHRQAKGLRKALRRCWKSLIRATSTLCVVKRVCRRLPAVRNLVAVQLYKELCQEAPRKLILHCRLIDSARSNVQLKGAAEFRKHSIGVLAHVFGADALEGTLRVHKTHRLLLLAAKNQTAALNCAGTIRSPGGLEGGICQGVSVAATLGHAVRSQDTIRCCWYPHRNDKTFERLLGLDEVHHVCGKLRAVLEALNLSPQCGQERHPVRPEAAVPSNNNVAAQCRGAAHLGTRDDAATPRYDGQCCLCGR
mmetsp:Transcript_48868/g.106234  ORF Transcript_48868/g.106234 Transcript_48868/m.106234 type:complete len:272 (-) Transcript_48868:61-876(-)